MPVSNNKLSKNNIFFHHHKGGSIQIKRPDAYEANVSPLCGLIGVGTQQNYNQRIRPTGVSGPINITGHGVSHGMDNLSFASKKKKVSNIKFKI